jgi:hypothetical protein
MLQTPRAPLTLILLAVGCGGGLGLTKYEVAADSGSGGLNVGGDGNNGSPDTGWGGGSNGGGSSGGDGGGSSGGDGGGSSGGDSSGDGGTGDDSSGDGGSGSTGGGSTGGGSTGGGSTGGGSTGGGSTGGGSTGGGSTGGGGASSVTGSLNLVVDDYFGGRYCSSSYTTRGTASSVSCAGCDFVFDMVASPGADSCGVGGLSYSVAVYPGYYGTYDAILYLYGSSWYLNGYALQSGSTILYGRYYDPIYLSYYDFFPYYYSRYGQFRY